MVFPGKSHPKKPVSINLNSSASVSIGELSPLGNTSFSSTRSQSTIRDSPDGASSLADGEDLASKLLIFDSHPVL